MASVKWWKKPLFVFTIPCAVPSPTTFLTLYSTNIPGIIKLVCILTHVQSKTQRRRFNNSIMWKGCRSKQCWALTFLINTVTKSLWSITWDATGHQWIFVCEYQINVYFIIIVHIYRLFILCQNLCVQPLMTITSKLPSEESFQVIPGLYGDGSHGTWILLVLSCRLSNIYFVWYSNNYFTGNTLAGHEQPQEHFWQE